MRHPCTHVRKRRPQLPARSSAAKYLRLSWAYAEPSAPATDGASQGAVRDGAGGSLVRAGPHRGPTPGTLGAQLSHRHADRRRDWDADRRAWGALLCLADEGSRVLEQFGALRGTVRRQRSRSQGRREAHRLDPRDRVVSLRPPQLVARPLLAAPGVAGVRGAVARRGRRARRRAHALRTRGRHRRHAGPATGDERSNQSARRALGRTRPAVRPAARQHPASRPHHGPRASGGGVFHEPRCLDGLRHGGCPAGQLVRPGTRRRVCATPEHHAFWRDLGREDDIKKLRFAEPGARTLLATDEQLDTVAEAFARVIDAKSPWTTATRRAWRRSP